ncbi:MAG: hypothetical protein PHS46_07610 [Candidatus Omnitrophica bacterium]|jgi:hypothetical protein|nr:hypothetical protein [Candidatus Omnitrophota bacterium]
MASERLHVLFHDLTGSIGGIATLSQICVAYITKFNMDRLEGQFKEGLSTTFKNIAAYHDRIAENLNLTLNVLAEIDSKGTAVVLESAIKRELKTAKENYSNAEMAYSELLKSDTKENLLIFAERLKKLEPICDSMLTAIAEAKDRLATQGKY